MATASGAPSDDLRALARKRVEDRRGFVPHLIIYLLINAGLVLIWAFVSGGGFFWPAFIIGFWGVGLVMHAWTAFVQRPITDADIDAELRRMTGPR